MVGAKGGAFWSPDAAWVGGATVWPVGLGLQHTARVRPLWRTVAVYFGVIWAAWGCQPPYLGPPSKRRFSRSLGWDRLWGRRPAPLERGLPEPVPPVRGWGTTGLALLAGVLGSVSTLLTPALASACHQHQR